MPDLSPVCCGSFSRAAGFTSQSLTFTLASLAVDSFRIKEIVHYFSECTNVIGCAAAAVTDDDGARLKKREQAFNHLLRRFVVNDFHVNQLGLSGIRLNHHGQAGYFLVALYGIAGALHFHSSAAVKCDDVRTMLLHEFRGSLRFNAHHGAEGGAIESHVVGHGTDDAL